MAMMISIPEILDEASAIKNRKERIEFLRKSDCLTLRMCLKGAFDPEIRFVNLGKKIEYEPDHAPFGHNPSHLHIEHKKFYLFMEGPTTLTVERRRQLLTQICEGLHPSEAEVFSQIVMGKFKRRGITEKVVREAFPGLLSEPVVPEKE